MINRCLLGIKKAVYRIGAKCGPHGSRTEFQNKADTCKQEICEAKLHATVTVEPASLRAGAQREKIIKPVDILIPVYNGLSFIAPCLESVIKNTDLPFHIYISDDASPNEAVYPLLQHYQQKYPTLVTLIKNKQNMGFASTVNKLMEMAKNDFVLLNSDTEVPQNWASRLMRPIFEDASVAACGPWTNAGCRQNFWFGHRDVLPETPWEVLDGIAQKFAPEVDVEFPDLIGFCLAISKAAYEKLGPLDMIYGRGYYEEIDWCLRAYSCGYKLKLAPDVFVFHKGVGSFGSSAKAELLKKNESIFHNRYPQAKKLMRAAHEQPVFAAMHFAFLLNYYFYQNPEIINNIKSKYSLNKTPTVTSVDMGDGMYKHIISAGAQRAAVYSKSPAKDFL